MLGLFEVFSLEIKVVQLVVQELNLLVRKSKGLPVYQALYGVELVHYDKVGVVVTEFNGVYIIFKKRVIELIMASLLQSQVQNTAEDLEKVLKNVLILSAILT